MGEQTTASDQAADVSTESSQGVSSVANEETNKNSIESTDVITSYSIHYTKLYDVCESMELLSIWTGRGLQRCRCRK